MATHASNPDSIPDGLVLVFKWCYLLTLAFLYFGWSWNKGGQTIGMKAWKIKVCPEETSIYPSLLGPQPGISWPQAVKRFLLAILSWAFFGIGFLIGLLRSDKLAFHDITSRTHLQHMRKT